ncbi:hypothetical protein RJ640_018880 [Escallonia rubra]|uniref:KIB1-4 beta-propeller domain-containing protein n=1 Tax=Escallonia rubra TaxID=112253 RepID=A0AA88RTI6_9ASTE|nr:hypothetical protein RJ640_018880 [Escallonia rubra]
MVRIAAVGDEESPIRRTALDFLQPIDEESILFKNTTKVNYPNYLRRNPARQQASSSPPSRRPNRTTTTTNRRRETSPLSSPSTPPPYVPEPHRAQPSPSCLRISREGVCVRPVDEDDCEYTYGTTSFQVFEVDLSNDGWTEVKNLGNLALFLGHNSFFSLRPVTKASRLTTYILRTTVWNRTSATQ